MPLAGLVNSDRDECGVPVDKQLCSRRGSSLGTDMFPAAAQRLAVTKLATGCVDRCQSRMR